MGRFGQKTGAGWYDYRPGDRTAYPNAEVDDMIVKHSQELGITRRKIDDAEIVERLVYSLVNEGAQILDERIAQRASDIDLVYLNGYGFPIWRGGPMFYADTVGLSEVVSAITRYGAVRAGIPCWCAWPKPVKASPPLTVRTRDQPHDRRRHCLHSPHRLCQVLAGCSQHDLWRDSRRSRRSTGSRTREDRSGGS